MVFLQGKIAVTGTPQKLSASTASNLSQIVFKAKVGNTAALVLVPASNSSVAVDGTGVGFIIEAGASVTLPVNQLSTIYVAGTLGDVYSVIGR